MGQGQECLPWATGPGGAGLGNVTVHSSHAGKGAGNADKLGGIWIGDRLVRPSFWDRPAPGEHGLPVQEAD